MNLKLSHILSLTILIILIFVAVNYDKVFNIQLPLNNETLESFGTNNGLNNIQSIDLDKDFINNESGIELTEFSDFECPFCKDASPLVKLILQKYNKQINYKFVHFGGHKNTIKAALASECAKEQGKFWTYHDLLFENQNSFSDKRFKQIAEQLNLNKIQFNDCYDTQKYMDKVKSDFELAQTSGISATPTYILNGKIVYLDEIPDKIAKIIKE